MTILFGSHISISKGLVKSIDYANSLGCKVMQIFSQSPRSFKGVSQKNINAIDKANEKLKEHNMIIVSHSPYLINLAKDPKNEKYMADALVNDLDFINKLGGIGSVVHMGKYVNLSKEEGLNNMENNIKNVLERYNGDAKLILETSCGQGTELLHDIKELGKFYKRFSSIEKKRIKFCIDTCHIFVAGYDMRSADCVDDFFSLFDKHIGINKVVLIHFNDSDKPYHSNVDRHDDIGNGYIGNKSKKGDIGGLKRVYEISKNNNIPMVLETHDIERDLKKVQKWK